MGALMLALMGCEAEMNGSAADTASDAELSDVHSDPSEPEDTQEVQSSDAEEMEGDDLSSVSPLPDVDEESDTADIATEPEDTPPPPAECAPTDTCLEGVAGICTTTGLWQAKEDCGEQGLLCVSGSCRSACEVGTDETALAGCDHWAVGLAHEGEGPFAISVLNPSETLPASVAIWGRLDATSDAEVVASAVVEPGHAHTFPLPPAMTRTPGTHFQGLRVRSTTPLIASQYSPLAAMTASSGDGSLLLPAHGLGTEYMAAGRPEGRTINSERRKASVTILATSPATQLTLVPSVALDAGETFGTLNPGEQTLIPLQPYEVLHLTTDAEGDDLSGTLIYASQPVAVFAGHEADRGAAPVPVEAPGDHLEDMLRPLALWGRVHVALRTTAPKGPDDGLILMAAEDDTLVQFDPPIHQDFVMSRGERAFRVLQEHAVVSSSRPIQVLQLTAGAESLATPPVGAACAGDTQCAPGYTCEDSLCALPACEGALDTSCPAGHRCDCVKTECRCQPIGDAALWTLAPTGQYEEDTDLVAPPTFPKHTMALAISAEVTQLKLDGDTINAPIQALGDSGWSLALVSITSGAHRVEADGPVGVTLFGFGQDSGYGHVAGQALRDLRGALCESDSECPMPLSPCFGFPFCDTSQVPARCSLMPESAVKCAPSDSPCVFTICDPEGGASCESVAAPEGQACASDTVPCATGQCLFGVCVNPVVSCDDGLFCNGIETCDLETNSCQSGTPPEVDDGIACSIDACDEELGKVTHLPDPALCDDGFVCNGVEVCDLFEGCVNQSPSICDDGVFCNGVEGCDDVNCFPGDAPIVDDKIPCTLDACNEAIGAVVHLPDHSLCADEDPCTIDTCDPTLGCTHTPDLCDDGDACTTDSCDPVLGCVHETLSCDDNDACTLDSCESVAGCLHEVSVCEDGDPCTEDFCLPSVGCVFGSSCDDGDACTLDGCTTPGQCTTTALNCADEDPCTNDSCHPDIGCLNINLCDDLNACTVDGCQGGGCTSEPLDCDDGDPCTEDSCNPATGCVNTALDCADGDPCTEDLCDALGACLNPPIDCEDGDACTNDLCDALGACVYTTNSCDDGIACTVDSCHSEDGCTNISPCDDGLYCTLDICEVGGGCTWEPMDCDDNDPCTFDSCDNASGCTYVNTCGGE